MPEEKAVSKPVQLWNNALKAVKGENTAQLVEEFTAEMTLVAEGLCEDQSRLRRDAESLRTRHEQLEQRQCSDVQALENDIRVLQRDTDQRLESIERRLAALETRLKSAPKKHTPPLMTQLIALVSIAAGAWVLVTLLNLFN